MFLSDSVADMGEQDLPGGLSDILLVERATEGCEIAYGELTRRYKGMMFSLAMRILKNREDAEDVVQETLLKVFTHLGSFKGESKFSTWLTRIVINSSLMKLRRRRSHPDCSLESLVEGDPSNLRHLASAWPSPEADYSQKELELKFHVAMMRLPPILRSVTISRYTENLSVAEAAKREGLSLAAAKSRLMRARNILLTMNT